MAFTNLIYALDQGFIHNWLVAGPEGIPVKKLSDLPQDQLELAIIWPFYTVESGVTETPVDLGPLQSAPGDQSLAWRYYRCQPDHYVDLTAFYPTCHYLRAWAYAQIAAPEAGEVMLALSTNGPADLWLNGQHIQRHEGHRKQIPLSVRFPASLAEGTNEILVRFENAAIRETPFCMALKIEGPHSREMTVIIPTEIESDEIEKRITYETILQKAYLEQTVYGWLTGDVYDQNEPVTVHFAEDLDLAEPLRVTYRLQSLNQDIFQESTRATDRTSVFELARLHPLRNGPHHLALLPPLDLYYAGKMQFERRELFHVVRTPYSPSLYGILKRRRKEALEEAAIRRGESIFSEIAKMALGRWDAIDRKIIHQTIERINQRHDGCIADLLGLIGVMYRFNRKPDLTDEFKGAILACILAFRYGPDEPGEDILDFQAESRQILFHTAELLAGQLYPKIVFTNAGQTGGWHLEKGERLALNWLAQRATSGWNEWDSNTGFEEEVAALSYLVDLAASISVKSQASNLLDKLFFTLAINSHQGAFGSTHGRSDTASLLSSRLEATSGISRLMWGMGNYNEALVGTVSLALMKGYDFPNLLKTIAVRPTDAFWDRERQGQGPYKGHGPREGHDPRGGAETADPVNKVTFRTRDGMLCSAQDYRPGQVGSVEHVWQATLGPDAVVFTNHPANFSLEDAHQPNFWRGNATLPRVAQWGDVLIALYAPAADDWLGFTHAYFPVKAFDETKLEGRWAFARKGQGYLALYSSVGFELITQGSSAFRELRAYGQSNAWFCQLGQELLDKSFGEFQQKILALDLAVDGLAVRVRTLRDDEITFGPESPLVINGQEQPLTGFKHYENPYCTADYPAKVMDVVLDDVVMRLDSNLD